jgi:hypothetical protein
MCTTALPSLETPSNEHGAQYRRRTGVLDLIVGRKHEKFITELSTEFGKLGYLALKV